jgi:conjugal transfer mating pair stabilization protein TraN
VRFLRAPLQLIVSLLAVFAWMLAQDVALAQDAAADAKNTAATIAQGLQGSLTATVTSTGSTSTVPGYTGQTSTDQSQYFSNPSALAGAGASAAQSSNAYAVVTEQRSTTIDPKSINLSTAQAIAADPSSVGAISTAGSGASGSCQTVQATAGNTGTYYDSCQIGSTEQDAAFTCTVGWRDVVATTTTYSCEQKVVSGINGGQATTVATLDSCTQLAAVSTCSKAGSSSVSGAEHYGVAGSGSIYQPPTIQFPSYTVDTTTNSYTCSQAVSVGAVASPPSPIGLAPMPPARRCWAMSRSQPMPLRPAQAPSW